MSDTTPQAEGSALAGEGPPQGPPGAPSSEPGSSGGRSEAGRWALYLSAFIVATCGLVYELVAGAMASYLLGDSITQFSLVIGCYLSAMGLGSYLSKFVKGNLLATFVRVEVAVGLVGGFSSVLLFSSYAFLGSVRPLLFTLVLILGTLVGLEIPVLMNVLKDEVSFSDLVARVLAFDYMGALAASVCFPLFLVPLLGLPRTAFAFGLLNAAVAIALTYAFREQLGRELRGVRLLAFGATFVLVLGFVSAENWATLAERQIYDATVLFKKKTRYQTIVVTRNRQDVRLLLDGHLQFSSTDERRYHESLVHTAVAALQGPLKHALVLGGGDGMALRELLRYPSLETATLVDLDPAMTALFHDEPMLAELNERSFHDPRAEVINTDAMKWLEACERFFDVVIIDFPDPRNYSLSKLYTRGMYRLIHRRVSRGGAVSIQATTPYGPVRAKRRGSRAYWCIVKTMADAGFTTHPYHAYVPSFGDWGFVLALKTPRAAPEALRRGYRGELTFLNDETLRGLFAFPRDLQAPEKLRVNRLNDQILVSYYGAEWGGAIGSTND